MRLKKIISQNQHDLTALYLCEHCGDQLEITTHKCKNHDDVLSNIECRDCGKKSMVIKAVILT